MKHTAALYTCIGLMGAAAIMGFADYRTASNKGELKDLYADETIVNPVVASKEVNLDDYSRGPIEPDMAVNDDTEKQPKKVPQKPKRPKKSVPPPPPPPPAPKKSKATGMLAAPAIPETPPAPAEVAISLDEAPTPPPVAETPVAPPPPPPAEVNEEVSFKYFSRAPLPRKKNAKSGKKQ